MNKFRKAISVGMSAALLASLFTVIAVPAALASVTVTSAGSVPIDGTSTGTVTFVFTEANADDFGTAPGTFDVVLTDDADASTISFSGTPVVSAPGSLGASASIETTTLAGDTLRVAIDDSDDLNVESITVSGLKLSATAAADLGAINATMDNFTGSIAITDLQSGGTASGFLDDGVAIGEALAVVNVTTTGCTFVDGTFDFAAGVAGTSAESLDGTAAAIVAGQQTLTITTAGGFTSAHNAGDIVTEDDACAPTGVLASPGTVTNKGEFFAITEPTVLPGENNQLAGDMELDEFVAGLLTDGATVTLTIATAGVTFSHPASAWVDAGDLNIGAGDGSNTLVVGSMNPTLTAATWTITDNSTVASELVFDDIFYDVAASVPAGTHVTVTATISTGALVDPASDSNAVVSRVLVGVGSTPIVYIGENNQPSGMITITEAGPGFFTDGTGTNNVFGLCLVTDEQFTLAPWAIVTTGDLRLREGAVASSDNIVLGTLTTNADGSSCAYWTVWTGSSTASAIEIRATDPAAPTAPLASGPTAGPRLSVGTPGADTAPGTTQAGIYTGSLTDITGGDDSDADSLVVFAVRAFRSGVVVAAVSQPSIPRGSTGSAAGNITITETLAGQLKAGEQICVWILPRTNQPTIQDTFLLQATQNQLPVLATTGGGLAVGPVSASMDYFCFVVTQQSVGTLGVITISNINYITTADAINGPVLVNVYKNGGPGVDFEAVVSNAKIGAVSVAEATINSGLNTRTGFGFGTEIVNRGAYVTIRSRASGSAPGDLVQIWVKTKTTPWMLETSRRVSPNGFMYYSGKVLNSGYRYYRVLYVTQGSISNTVRAYGR